MVVFSPQAITFMTMQPELLDRKNHKNDPLTRPESHVRVEIRKRLQNSTTKHAPCQKSKPNNMFSGNQCCFGSDSISPNLVSGLAGDKYFWPPASIFSLRIEREGICINIFFENGGGEYLPGEGWRGGKNISMLLWELLGLEEDLGRKIFDRKNWVLVTWLQQRLQQQGKPTS